MDPRSFFSSRLSSFELNGLLDRRLFEGGLPGWMPLVGTGPFLLYELAALYALRWRAARDKDFPRYGRFANALIETSLPGVIIVVLSRHMDPQLVHPPGQRLQLDHSALVVGGQGPIAALRPPRAADNSRRPLPSGARHRPNPNTAQGLSTRKATRLGSSIRRA